MGKISHLFSLFGGFVSGYIAHEVIRRNEKRVYLFGKFDFYNNETDEMDKNRTAVVGLNFSDAKYLLRGFYYEDGKTTVYNPRLDGAVILRGESNEKIITSNDGLSNRDVKEWLD